MDKLIFQYVTPDKIGVLVRHALSGVGAVVVANGVASNSQVQDIIGGATVLAVVLWSWAQKEAQKRAVKAALMTPPPAVK